jgi:5-methylcytosine-specific restriction endonuclease McrA
MSNETGSNLSPTKVEFIVFIVSCLLVLGGCSSDKPNGVNTATDTAKTSSPPAPDFQKQHQQAEEQFRPQIEAERQKDQKEAEQALDQDAIVAVEQTDGAIKSIAENKKADAMASIERATGKINILLARNPASALIPVHAEVVVIDAAPADVKVIDQIVQRATDAMKQRNLPAARILLASVVSELRIRTTSLPLGTYPAALQQAARLLDQGKNQEAGDVLLTAVNTLVTVDHVIPLPLLLAQSAIDAANSHRQDKEMALTLLQTAKIEADRSRHLGYLGDESEYKALDQEIASVETAVKGKSDTSSAFAQLRDRIAGFLKREREQEHRG